MTGRIGILAYGSLIVDPGNEIGSLTIGRLNCVTPFAVEYARLSKKRDYAPTLIPVATGGCPVNAVILLLKPETSLQVAKDILWRRETRQDDLSRPYPEHKPPGEDSVRVEVIHNLAGVETVIYTSISRNISVDTPAFSQIRQSNQYLNQPVKNNSTVFGIY
ncbi:hypothetical protein [Mucilaginibacter sp.]|uniref:hypothetical protein n=1 Tax=Mucilaginibacter sp. TaxID=1882438 RepID=UPI003D12A0F0